MTPQIKVYTHALIRRLTHEVGFDDSWVRGESDKNLWTSHINEKIQPDKIICFLLTFKRLKIDVSASMKKKCTIPPGVNFPHFGKIKV